MRAHDPQSAENTIFALSTGTGPAGIAVVRVSGPNALEAFQLTKSGRIGSERRAELRKLIDVLTGDRIDDALVHAVFRALGALLLFGSRKRLLTPGKMSWSFRYMGAEQWSPR